MYRKLIKALCQECGNIFELYEDSLVDYSVGIERGKLTDIFFVKYRCPLCFHKHYKSIGIYLKVGALRFKEYNDDKWIVANLL